MKKLLLTLFALIRLLNLSYAQFIYAQYSQTYSAGVRDKPSNVGIIVAITQVNNSFWITNPSESLYNSPTHDRMVLPGRKGEIVPVTTFDTSKAQFLLHGVNQQNAAYFEYRVITGSGKILYPWGSVTQFTSSTINATSGMPPMAYLGGYSTIPGDRIIVDVRLKDDTNILKTAVVAWVPIKPIVSEIYTPARFDLFMKRLSHPWSYRESEEKIDKWKKEYAEDEIDSVTHRPKKLKLEATENNLIFYFLADIFNRNQVEYQLIKDDKILINWKPNDFDNQFVWLKNLKPGDYTLNIRYTAQREHVTSNKFLIKTPWYQSLWFKNNYWFTNLRVYWVNYIIINKCPAKTQIREGTRQENKIAA